LDRGAPGDKPTHTPRDQHTLSAISTTQRHERKINNETTFFKEQALSTKETPTRTKQTTNSVTKRFQHVNDNQTIISNND
jgi:hypothetical protein